MTQSYKESHTGENKGLEYDKNYSTISWRKTLWEQEKLVLNSIINTFFDDNEQINLLDFACGTGRITGILEDRVNTSTGVDISETMLSEAEKKLKKTKLLQGDLTQSNILQEQKFNLITSFRFFLNAEPKLRKNVIRLLVSMLDQDGYLVFNNHRNRTSPLIWLKYIYRHKIKKDATNFLSISETRNLVQEAGLEIGKIYPVGLLSTPLIKPPKKLSNFIDNFAMRFPNAGIFSESPIIVCKRAR